MSSLILMACSSEMDDVLSQHSDINVFYAATPEYDRTKVYIDAERCIFWHADDQISVFRSITNEKFQFAGNTGEVINEFNKKDDSQCGEIFSCNYAIYPYSPSNTCLSEGSYLVTLPELQHYAGNSFGRDANLMTAVTENSVDNVFYFKNVCSYLKLKLYGGDSVRKIVLRGNANEKLAGDALLTFQKKSDPSLDMSNASISELTLDCGEYGVATGKNSDNSTVFWLVIPPMKFKTGFAIDVYSVSGAKKTIRTDKEQIFTRNFIKTMQAVECNMDNCCNMLDFSLSDGSGEFKAFRIDDGYIDIQVPNGTDMTNMVAIFDIDGIRATVDGVEQTSGIDTHDFSDFVNPITYVVSSYIGITQTYKVRMFNLPIVSVETPERKKISSKDIWTEDVTMTIREYDGTVTTINSIKVRGRGNITWGFPKKPYNIKLQDKTKILGMKKSKHWALMAAWRDRTLARDEIVSRLGRQLPSLGWQPDGRYVEFFLNGVHQGVYRFSERVKVDKNRVSINEEGGYLLEYDRYEDEPVYFKTQTYNQIVKVKYPDEDEITPFQLNYINDYINNLELSLYDKERFNSHEYLEYLDIESFIDWYLLYEVLANTDATHNSRYRIKDTDGKLKCGPTWDAELIYMTSVGYSSWIAKGEPYIKRMFDDPLFVQRLKEKWSDFKTAVSYSSTLNTGFFPEQLDEISQQLHSAQERNFKIYPITNNVIGDSQMEYDEAILNLKTFYYNRMKWLDNKINELK